MDKEFFSEINFEDVKEYDKPFGIVIFGLPGSGKTHASQLLAEKLGIYLFSADYVRNYYYNKYGSNFMGKRTIEETNVERVYLAIHNKASFVFDSREVDMDSSTSIMKALLRRELDLVIVNVKSKDEDNIVRLRDRKYDPEFRNDNILGDSGFYTPACGEEQYLDRKKRTFIIGEGTSNLTIFTIENHGTLTDFDEKIIYIVEQIKQKNKQKGDNNE